MDDSLLSRLRESEVCFLCFPPGRHLAACLRLSMRALQRLHELLDIVVAAGRDEVEHASARAEDEAQFEAGATLEVVALQAANAKAGMQVRCAEAVANGVDHSRDLAAA